MTDSLRLLIREYFDKGGRDAFSFSAQVSPRYGDVPGREIQRLIDEEVEEDKRKGSRYCER